MRASNIYAGLALDRAQHRRRDEAWLKARLVDPASAILPLWQGLLLIAESEMPTPALLQGEEAAALIPNAEWALLGLAGDQAVFALDLRSAGDAPPDLAPWGRFLDLRQVGPLLARTDAAL